MKIFVFLRTLIEQKLRYMGGVCGLIVFCIPAYFRKKEAQRLVRRIIVTQIFFTGTKALVLISQVALAIGAITVLQLFTQLSKFGALEYVGRILNIVIIRELGPIITTFIVISRSSSAIAAEIGTMNVTNQIDALEMLGIDPLRLIVFPRLVGMIISVVLLTIYFNAIGIIGGFIVGSITADISFDMFMNYVMNSIGIVDVLSGCLKGFVFSFFIAAIPIYQGFQARAITQIPQITTNAVMSCIVVTLFFDILFTVLFYLL